MIEEQTFKRYQKSLLYRLNDQRNYNMGRFLNYTWDVRDIHTKYYVRDSRYLKQ